MDDLFIWLIMLCQLLAVFAIGAFVSDHIIEPFIKRRKR